MPSSHWWVHCSCKRLLNTNNNIQPPAYHNMLEAELFYIVFTTGGSIHNSCIT